MGWVQAFYNWALDNISDPNHSKLSFCLIELAVKKSLRGCYEEHRVVSFDVTERNIPTSTNFLHMRCKKSIVVRWVRFPIFTPSPNRSASLMPWDSAYLQKSAHHTPNMTCLGQRKVRKHEESRLSICLHGHAWLGFLCSIIVLKRACP
jgi:hypothetical protein